MRKIRRWRERIERVLPQPMSKDALSYRLQMLVRTQNHKAGSVMKDRTWQNNGISSVHSISTADLMDMYTHKTSFLFTGFFSTYVG